MTWSEAANLAVNQTLMRSINTSVIALLPVAGLLFVGAGLLGVGTLKDLALVLFVGPGRRRLLVDLPGDADRGRPQGARARGQSRCAGGCWPAGRRRPARAAHARGARAGRSPAPAATRRPPGGSAVALAERDLPGPGGGRRRRRVAVLGPARRRLGRAPRPRVPGARPQRPGAKGRPAGKKRR